MSRVVLDTNVLIAANLTKHDSSPNKQLLERWQKGDFTFLFSLDILAEYEEKLVEKGVCDEDIEELFTLIFFLGEEVSIDFYHLKIYPTDIDDIVFLLCALNGTATHLVSYDDHLLSLRESYLMELDITTVSAFLRHLNSL